MSQVYVATLLETIDPDIYYQVESRPIFFQAESTEMVEAWKVKTEYDYNSGVEVDVFGDGYEQSNSNSKLEIFYNTLEDYVDIFSQQKLISPKDYEFLGSNEGLEEY